MPRDPADVDLVKALLRLARSVAPGVTGEQWRALEVEAKARWGGQRKYVPLPQDGARRARRRAG